MIHDIDESKFVRLEELPHFSFLQDEWGTKLVLKLKESDKIFGLGEVVGALNRRGKGYRLFAKDDPNHTPDKGGLYGSHPFFILHSERPFGVFLDFPGEVHIDAGFKVRDELEIYFPSHDFDLYVFEESSASTIISSYLELVGAPCIPPDFAFGYQQSRYSYMDARRLNEVADEFRAREIPCDVLYLDIDYMEGYKCFTIDNERFPDFKKFSTALQHGGFKFVPILDPGIKKEHHYQPYDTGIFSNRFCVDEAGKPFEGGVWPGITLFPDFLNSACRHWWAGLCKELVEQGFAGLWNDMNEPAIFYTPKSLETLKKAIHEIQDKHDLGTNATSYLENLWSFWHPEKAFKEFFHTLDDGTKVLHFDVHNLYGTAMARASYDGLTAAFPGKRNFLLSRSSYPGLHRFAMVWTGDNHSWWEHLRLHVQMMLSLNLCGFFFNGADIGGFSGNASAELLIRWTELGVLTPFFRNHSVKGSRDQEPWAFDDETTEIIKNTIRLRYALFPYLYSEYIRSVTAKRPFVAPMFLHEENERTLEIDDAFFVGDTILAAPIITQNATGRFVHLPKGKWLAWNASSFEKRQMSVIHGGDHYINASLEELPLFLRENRLLPLTPPLPWIAQDQMKGLIIVGLVTHHASFTIYQDNNGEIIDGKGVYSTLDIDVRREGNDVKASVKKHSHPEIGLSFEFVHFEIYDEHGNLSKLEVRVH